ncbi:hypothetical protein [Selenomonas ruminis]|uniref:DUF4315 family protein n=1 Tax=Selenomonas ruminis TaxID=2593411 RepID=A0A5D6VYC1_9FIRM|nr:hypothetical protein [Selenomonas sp. mPRGC5]TYZ20507.1 hypothetical protein FZ040_11870 [Selenomonas sp. mPRGC5]
MNISHQEVESIYQIVSGDGEKKVEQLAKKKEQLEVVEKDLDKLRDRRNKLKAEIKTMEYSLNANKHSNMVGELSNFGIDLEDKETMQQALRLIIENMGKEKKPEMEKSTVPSSGDTTEVKNAATASKASF